MLVLTPTQTYLELNGVAALQPSDRLINPNFIVRLPDIGAQSHFLYRGPGALLLAFAALVLVLTVVQNFGYRGFLIGGNHYQIELGSFCQRQRFRRIRKSAIGTLIVNQKNLRRTDLLID